MRWTYAEVLNSIRNESEDGALVDPFSCRPTIGIVPTVQSYPERHIADQYQALWRCQEPDDYDAGTVVIQCLPTWLGSMPGNNGIGRNGPLD